MTNPLGSFIWYELMTNDADRVGPFYEAVAGWTVSPGDPVAPVDYRHIGRADGGANGGILQLTPEMQEAGAHPAWVPYFHVADVDAEVAAVEAEGGRVLMAKTTIPEGSFAMATDPMGTPFYVMTPVPPPGKPDAKSDVFSVSEAGHMRWNELASPDQDRAKDFYARHFGFEFNNSMPMGAMGDYCFIEHHGDVLGAIMRQQPGQPPLWVPYIGVNSAEEAKRAIEANGGKVLNGPHQVPGGEWVVQAEDPSGARFGVVGPKGD